MSVEGLSDTKGPPGSKNVRKRAKKTKSGQHSSETSAVESIPLREGKITMETRSQISKRLREGVTYAQGAGFLLRGTIENPIELAHKTAPIPESEIVTLVSEIAEVKHLLFCRLLLSHASLLPAALRANSVEEFLNGREVADADLRDLCLKMENPVFRKCAMLVQILFEATKRTRWIKLLRKSMVMAKMVTRRESHGEDYAQRGEDTRMLSLRFGTLSESEKCKSAVHEAGNISNTA